MIPVDPKYFVDPTPNAGARLGQILGLGGSAAVTNILKQRAYKALGIAPETAYLSPQVQSAYIKQSQKNKVLPFITELLNKRASQSPTDNYLLPSGQRENINTQPTISPLPGIPNPPPITDTVSNRLPGIPTNIDETIDEIVPQPQIAEETNPTIDTNIPEPIKPPEAIRLPSYIQRPSFDQDDVNKLAFIDPKAAKVYQSQIDNYNNQLKDFAEKQEKQAQPAIDRSNTLSLGLARQQYGIDSMKGAVQRGGRFGWDYIAQKFGSPFLATPEGSQLNTVKKQFLITDIEGISRPNMFIDKKVDDAYPQVGKSRAANKTTIEVLEAKHDIESKYVEYTNQLAEEDRQNYGFVQANLQKRVTEKLNTYAKERYKITERRLIDINYPENVPFKIKDPETKKYKYYVVPHSQVDTMLNNGAEVNYEF